MTQLIPITQLKGADTALPKKKQVEYHNEEKVMVLMNGSINTIFSNTFYDKNAEIYNEAVSQLSTIAVVLDEEEMKNVVLKALFDWANYERTANYQQYSVRISKDEFIAQAITQNTARVVRLERIEDAK